MVDKAKIEQAVRLLLEGIGEDITREGLIDTPVSASKEGVVHNRSFFVILTTDSFEALFISYFKPAGIR